MDKRDIQYLDNYRWAPIGLTYIVTYDDRDPDKFENVSCFSALGKLSLKHMNSIYMEFPIYKGNEEHYEFYLNYLKDMFKLEAVEITQNSIKFKAFPHYVKNLMVLSCVRFLYEHIGNTTSTQQQDTFIRNIRFGKCKFKTKFEHFCFMYRAMKVGSYFSTGHSWEPKETYIKTYEEFNQINGRIRSVNSFFTNGKQN